MPETPNAQGDVAFAIAAGQLAAHTRCHDIVLLNVSERSHVTRYFLIATGTSARQMRTVADQIGDLGEKMGFKPWRISGTETAKWVLIDCIDVVVHLFDAASRAFYDLEILWGDCPRIDMGLPESATTRPQTEKTQSALEAIEEAIEVATEMDDELLLEEPLSTEGVPAGGTPDDSATFLGIPAPPNDDAIIYESISIDVVQSPDTEGIPVPAAPPKPARKPAAVAKSAKSKSAAKPAAKKAKAAAKMAPKAAAKVARAGTKVAKKVPAKAKPKVKAKTAGKPAKKPAARKPSSKKSATAGKAAATGKARPKPAVAAKKLAGGKIRAKTSAATKTLNRKAAGKKGPAKKAAAAPRKAKAAPGKKRK